MSKINKCVLAKKNGKNEPVYLYPKTTADMVYVDDKKTASDELNELKELNNTINTRVDSIITTPADSVSAQEVIDARLASCDNEVKGSLNARINADYQSNKEEINNINDFINTKSKSITVYADQTYMGYRFVTSPSRTIEDTSLYNPNDTKKNILPNSTVHRFKVEPEVTYRVIFKGGEYRKFGFSNEEIHDNLKLESRGFFGATDPNKNDVTYSVKNKDGMKYLYVWNTGNCTKGSPSVVLEYDTNYVSKEWVTNEVKEIIGNKLYNDTDIYSDFEDIKAINVPKNEEDGGWTSDNVYVNRDVEYTFILNDEGQVSQISASTLEGKALNGVSKVILSSKYKLYEGSIIKISGCPKGGGFIGYYLALCDTNGKVICTDFGDGAICKITKTANYRLRIRFMTESDVYEEYKNIIFTPKLEYVSVQDQINEIKTTKSLTVASWNCGNFIGGISTDEYENDIEAFTGYPYDNYEEVMEQTATAISSINADIFGVCESSRYAYRDRDTNQKVYTDDALYNKLFAYNYIIHKSETGHTGGGEVGILMNDRAYKFGQIKFTNSYDSSKNKIGSNKFTYAIYRVNNKEIFLACVHLVHSIKNVEERKKELQQLFEYCEDYEDAIIFGDFNLHYKEEYDYIAQYGWQSANGNNIWGYRMTQKGFGNNAIPYALDTIIVKGNLLITDFKVINYRFSDHYPIVATIRLL